VPGATSGLDAHHRITVPVSNLIGSTRAVIDLVSGEVVEAGGFYPNGAREELLGADGTLNGEEVPVEPAGFTGKEADEEVGLTYFGERYLVARTGRWATPDPLHIHALGGGEAGNSYHYVSGNLMQARDPLGLDVVTLGIKADLRAFEGGSLKFGVFATTEADGEIRLGFFGEVGGEAGVGSFGGVGIEATMLRGQGQDGLDGTDVGVGGVVGSGMAVGGGVAHSTDDIADAASEYFDGNYHPSLKSENEYSAFLGLGYGAAAGVEVSHTKSFTILSISGSSPSHRHVPGGEIRPLPTTTQGGGQRERALLSPPGSRDIDQEQRLDPPSSAPRETAAEEPTGSIMFMPDEDASQPPGAQESPTQSDSAMCEPTDEQVD
jgi:RHS repeat-associated protein